VVCVHALMRDTRVVCVHASKRDACMLHSSACCAPHAPPPPLQSAQVVPEKDRKLFSDVQVGGWGWGVGFRV